METKGNATELKEAKQNGDGCLRCQLALPGSYGMLGQGPVWKNGGTVQGNRNVLLMWDGVLV